MAAKDEIHKRGNAKRMKLKRMEDTQRVRLVQIESRGSRTEGRPELGVESRRVESREAMAAKDEIQLRGNVIRMKLEGTEDTKRVHLFNCSLRN